jgi:hypothetical protein
MMKREAALYSLVSWIGVGLVVASVIAATVKADQRIWMSLCSSSLLGLWIACLLFFKSAKEDRLETKGHYLEVEAALTNILGPGKMERQLLESGVRALLFGGSEIDDVFCVKYGELLLSDGDAFLPERLREVLDAKKTSRVSVERSKAYTLMHYLFRKVSESHEKYLALATELDLGTPEARSFLFKDPQVYPHSILRIFVLRSRESLQKMLDGAGPDLRRQIDLGAKLKVLIDPDGVLPNFGIYGSLAVGYFIDRDTNVFDFQRTNVSSRKQMFEAYWEQAEDLESYLTPPAGGPGESGEQPGRPGVVCPA